MEMGELQAAAWERRHPCRRVPIYHHVAGRDAGAPRGSTIVAKGLFVRQSKRG
jgi:hypothetical protein